MPLKGTKTAPGENRAQTAVKKSNILAQMPTASSGGGDAPPPRGDAPPRRVFQATQPSPEPVGASDAEPVTTTVVLRKTKAGPKVDDDSGIITVSNRTTGNFRNMGQGPGAVSPPENVGGGGGRVTGQPPSGRQERDRGDRDSIIHVRSGGDFHSLRDNFEREPSSAGVSPGSRSDRSTSATGGYARQPSRDSIQISSREATPRQSIGPDGAGGASNGVLLRTASGAEVCFILFLARKM